MTLKLKYADFTLVTRRLTLDAPTDDGAAIFGAVRADLRRADLSRPVRLTGVSVSGFGEEGGPPQLELFGSEPAPGEAKRARLNAAIDDLADRFGDGAVRPATLSDRRRR